MKYFLIVSLFANVVLVYLLFDSAVSLDGCRMNGKHMSARTEMALKVLNDSWKGLPVETALKVVGKFQSEGEIVKIQKSKVHLGDLVFQVNKDNTIKEVYFLGD